MSGMKILVVDDNPSLLAILKQSFASRNYEVFTATKGEDALLIVKAQRPDIVILDVMMAGKNGFEVCREIKETPELRETPVVMLTAKSQESDRFWGLGAGADEYVLKPFDPVALESLVENILDLKRKGEMPNPITKLPGAEALEKNLGKRRASRQLYAVATLTFDEEAEGVFKAKYGEMKFAGVLRLTAGVIREVVALCQDKDIMVAHVGDTGFSKFILVTPPEIAEKLCQGIESEFKSSVEFEYDRNDRKQKFVSGFGSQGESLKFSLLQLKTEIRYSGDGKGSGVEGEGRLPLLEEISDSKD
ncbi:MAG: response regulator [Candidatus Eisenbacteria bacterium]|nr:response regulator [Candidatus Eisenbacteria bacterium]